MHSCMRFSVRARAHTHTHTHTQTTATTTKVCTPVATCMPAAAGADAADADADADAAAAGRHCGAAHSDASAGIAAKCVVTAYLIACEILPEYADGGGQAGPLA